MKRFIEQNYSGKPNWQSRYKAVLTEYNNYIII